MGVIASKIMSSMQAVPQTKTKSPAGRIKKMAKKAAAQGMSIAVNPITGKVRMVHMDKDNA